MSILDTPWGLLGIAFFCAFVWRAAGAALSGRIEVDTPLFDWCICVTQAIVGGLMIRAIFWPSTQLANVPLSDRAAAMAIALAVFYAGRKSIFAGVVAGSLVLAASVAWRSL
jgi:hypothetical protein